MRKEHRWHVESLGCVGYFKKILTRKWYWYDCCVYSTREEARDKIRQLRKEGITKRLRAVRDLS